jgi:GT2 family glycosyltransferase
MKLGICTITDGGNAVYPSCIANMVNSLDLLDYDMHWYIHQNGVEDDLPEVAAVSLRDDTTTTRSADYRGISKNRNDLAQAALDDGCGAVIWIDDDIVVPWVDEGVAISRDGGWIDGLLTPLEADAAVFAVGLSPCVCTEDFNTM